MSISKDNKTGWIKYSSGLIEQWGYKAGNGTVTFLVPFQNTNYNIVACPAGPSGGFYWASGGLGLKHCTTTSFYFMSLGDDGGTYTATGCWHAWGF